MKKVVFFVVAVFSFLSLKAQVVNQNQNRNQMQNNRMFQNDSTTFKNEVQVLLDGTTKFTDYKKFTIANDTSYVDTTLTLSKDFKFNYIRKDDFELLGFHNQGQTYNRLAYELSGSLYPEMGMTAKQYNYYRLEDVPFYHVPTPTSELMYRTGFEQGQVLDAFVTVNTSPDFNASIGYKGLRSLGKYRHTLSSHGNFSTTFNYRNKKNTYNLRGQFYSFDFLNSENGGLTEESVINFENNNPNYVDRARLDVHYTDAENMFEGKRYYLDQKLTLFSRKNAEIRKERARILLEKLQDSVLKAQQLKVADSIAKLDSISRLDPNFKSDSLAVAKNDSLVVRNDLKEAITDRTDDNNSVQDIQADTAAIDSLQVATIDSLEVPSKDRSYFEFDIGHALTYQTAHYRFKQEAANERYGTAFTDVIDDHTLYKYSNNEVFLGLNSNSVGRLRVKGNSFDYNYHYHSILYYDDNTIPDKLKGNALSVGADWKKKIGKLNLNASANSIISGDLEGESFKANLSYRKDSVYSIKAYGSVLSRTPAFNKLLFQSDYESYNWYNSFDNEEITSLGGKIKLDKWGYVDASINTIDNYTYFDENSKPVQASESVNYLKVKAHLKLSYRKFTLENTVLYQKVSEGDTFFRVPELLTRNSFYFSSHIFRGNPLYLLTGVTVKYFLPYQLPAYDPILSEFILQNDAEYGGFPIVDFFINAQIQRTRLYLKAENFAGSYTGRNYYAAPGYPYRDFTVRFGLVWNFFI